jgi:hypothetical protein
MNSDGSMLFCLNWDWVDVYFRHGVMGWHGAWSILMH